MVELAAGIVAELAAGIVVEFAADIDASNIGRAVLVVVQQSYSQLAFHSNRKLAVVAFVVVQPSVRLRLWAAIQVLQLSTFT